MRFDFRNSWDLSGIVAFSLILIAVILAIPESPVRVVIGLPFILFFPGYVLIAFLFPRESDLGIIERIALSFGLSIAVTPLIGLGLNYTPFGIRLEPILACLTAFNIAFAILAEYRRGKVEDPYRPIQPERLKVMVDSALKGGSRLDRALTIVLVISIACSVIALAYVVAVPKEGERFTEFYILGPGGQASDYPTNLTVGEEASLIIGIANHESQTVYYGIELWLVNASFVDNQTQVHQMYFFDSFNVTLEPTPPSIEGNWTPQWELDYDFFVDIEGDFKMWFLLFEDEHEFEGVMYQDYASTEMTERIVMAVEGDLLSLNLNMSIAAP